MSCKTSAYQFLCFERFFCLMHNTTLSSHLKKLDDHSEQMAYLRCEEREKDKNYNAHTI